MFSSFSSVKGKHDTLLIFKEIKEFFSLESNNHNKLKY